MQTAKVARLTLIGVSIIFVSLILTSISYAGIDPQSIVGIWLFEEGKGDVVSDSSSNGNDGEIVGAEWVEGKIGKGLEFDGTNHVEIPASESTDDYMEGFTYLLWVKPTAPPPNANTRLIERDWHNPAIQISNANSFYGSTVIGGGLDNSAVTGGTWEMDQWSFVALTYDGTTLSLYVDSEMVEDLEVAEPDFTKDNAQGAIRLAAWKDPGWDFRGVLDEVGVFNVALVEDDIKSIFNDGLSPAAVSPKAKLTTIWGQIKCNFYHQ